MIGKPSEYEAMARCEKDLWWYRSLHDITLLKMKAHFIEPSASILDAGCGTGGMMQKLLIHGYQNVVGFDYSTDAVRYSTNSGLNDIRLLDIRACDGAYAHASFDVIICHDIICLLDEPDAKLSIKNLATLLKPGGLLLLNLPAGRLFKGTHDVAVGIKERYSKDSVIQLAGAPYRILESFFWPFLMSPPIFLIRLLQRIKLRISKFSIVPSDVKMPSSLLNNLFVTLSLWENRHLSHKPWGSSVFSILQKV